MKVLMVLSNPLIVDPRVYKEAKALQNAGHELRVIVWDRNEEYSPVGDVNGIKVFRIHLRARDGLSTVASMPRWWFAAYKRAISIYKNWNYDVVHVHDLDTLPVGVALKSKFKLPLIYDAHEIYGYMIASQYPKLFSKIAFTMEKWMVRKVDRIITVNENLRDYFNRITDKPVHIVMNCKELIMEDYKPPKNDVFTVCYIGLLHKNRMFPEILDVIGNIEGVRFVIAGKKENLYWEVEKKVKNYKNIVFLGTLPHDKVIETTLNCDAVVHMVNPEDINNRLGYANKQFEAMVCGRPIITTKGTSAGELTEKTHAGLVIDYSPEALREAIILLRDNRDLREQLGKNGLKAAKEFYNWQRQEKELLKVYSYLK